MRACDISKLSASSKRQAWIAIQRDHPALAEFMRSDLFAMLRDIMGASVLVTVDSRGRIQVQVGESS